MRMHRRLITRASLLLLANFIVISGSIAAQHVSPELANAIPRMQQDWGRNPILITAVRAQNARPLTLAKIKAIDRRWRDTPGFSSFMFPYLENRAVFELLLLEKKAGYVLESFVTDKRGALVGASNKTSDFWQGDEDKFIQSFNRGIGQVHIGSLQFDQSVGRDLLQVTVPIMDGGKAIGAVTIGINLSAFKKNQKYQQ